MWFVVGERTLIVSALPARGALAGRGTIVILRDHTEISRLSGQLRATAALAGLVIVASSVNIAEIVKAATITARLGAAIASLVLALGWGVSRYARAGSASRARRATEQVRASSP